MSSAHHYQRREHDMVQACKEFLASRDFIVKEAPVDEKLANLTVLLKGYQNLHSEVLSTHSFDLAQELQMLLAPIYAHLLIEWKDRSPEYLEQEYQISLLITGGRPQNAMLLTPTAREEWAAKYGSIYANFSNIPCQTQGIVAEGDFSTSNPTVQSGAESEAFWRSIYERNDRVEIYVGALTYNTFRNKIREMIYLQDIFQKRVNLKCLSPEEIRFHSLHSSHSGGGANNDSMNRYGNNSFNYGNFFWSDRCLISRFSERENRRGKLVLREYPPDRLQIEIDITQHIWHQKKRKHQTMQEQTVPIELQSWTNVNFKQRTAYQMLLPMTPAKQIQDEYIWKLPQCYNISTNIVSSGNNSNNTDGNNSIMDPQLNLANTGMQVSKMTVSQQDDISNWSNKLRDPYQLNNIPLPLDAVKLDLGFNRMFRANFMTCHSIEDVRCMSMLQEYHRNDKQVGTCSLVGTNDAIYLWNLNQEQQCFLDLVSNRPPPGKNDENDEGDGGGRGRGGGGTDGDDVMGSSLAAPFSNFSNGFSNGLGSVYSAPEVEIETNSPVYDLATQGRWIYAGTGDGVQIYRYFSAGKVKQINSFGGRSSGTGSLCWSIDSIWFGNLLTSGHRGVAYLWDVRAEKAQNQVRPARVFPVWDEFDSSTDVHCVKFHHTGEYVATSIGRRGIALWDAPREAKLVRIMPSTEPILSMNFSVNGLYLHCGCLDGSLSTYDLRMGKQISDSPIQTHMLNYKKSYNGIQGGNLGLNQDSTKLMDGSSLGGGRNQDVIMGGTDTSVNPSIVKRWQTNKANTLSPIYSVEIIPGTELVCVGGKGGVKIVDPFGVKESLNPRVPTIDPVEPGIRAAFYTGKTVFNCKYHFRTNTVLCSGVDLQE